MAAPKKKLPTPKAPAKSSARFTKAMDDKADRRAGIKENSKRDVKLDKKRGVK